MSNLELKFLAENIAKIIRHNGAEQAFVLIEQGGIFGVSLDGDPELLAHSIGSVLARTFDGPQLERCIRRFNDAARGVKEGGHLIVTGGEFSKSGKVH